MHHLSWYHLCSFDFRLRCLREVAAFLQTAFCKNAATSAALLHSFVLCRSIFDKCAKTSPLIYFASTREKMEHESIFLFALDVLPDCPEPCLLLFACFYQGHMNCLCQSCAHMHTLHWAPSVPLSCMCIVSVNPDWFIMPFGHNS